MKPTDAAFASNLTGWLTRSGLAFVSSEVEDSLIHIAFFSNHLSSDIPVLIEDHGDWFEFRSPIVQLGDLGALKDRLHLRISAFASRLPGTKSRVDGDMAYLTSDGLWQDARTLQVWMDRLHFFARSHEYIVTWLSGDTAPRTEGEIPLDSIRASTSEPTWRSPSSGEICWASQRFLRDEKLVSASAESPATLDIDTGSQILDVARKSLSRDLIEATIRERLAGQLGFRTSLADDVASQALLHTVRANASDRLMVDPTNYAMIIALAIAERYESTQVSTSLKPRSWPDSSTLANASMGLEDALSRPVSDGTLWRLRIGMAVEYSSKILVEHARQCKIDGGLFDVVLDEVPRLQNHVEALQQRQRELLTDVDRLMRLIASVSDDEVVKRAGQLRDNAVELLGQIVRYRVVVADLIWEAYALDVAIPSELGSQADAESTGGPVAHLHDPSTRTPWSNALDSKTTTVGLRDGRRTQPVAVDDGRTFYCPVCTEVTSGELLVEQIALFDDEGRLRVSAFEPVYSSSEIGRILDRLHSGEELREYVVRHRRCMNIVTTQRGLLNIALLGTSGVGKTHLFLAFLHRAMTMRTGTGITVRSTDPFSTDELLRVTQQVFLEHRVAGRTTMSRLGDQRPSRLAVEAPMPTKQITRREAYIHDVAGDIADGGALMNQALPFMKNVGHLILCIDPSSIPAVARRLGTPVVRQRFVDIVTVAADMIRAGSSVTPIAEEIQPAPASISVVVTKADQLLELGHSNWDSLIAKQLMTFAEDARFETWDEWADRLREHSSVTREFLIDQGSTWGESFVDLVERHFAGVSYHLTSALGGPEVIHLESSASQVGFDPTSYTTAGVVEPFARGFWISVGWDPMDAVRKGGEPAPNP